MDKTNTSLTARAKTKPLVVELTYPSTTVSSTGSHACGDCVRPAVSGDGHRSKNLAPSLGELTSFPII